MDIIDGAIVLGLTYHFVGLVMLTINGTFEKRNETGIYFIARSSVEMYTTILRIILKCIVNVLKWMFTKNN